MLDDTSVAAVLIIDNDDVLVEALRTRFVHHGYRCVTASGGAQGLAAFRERDIDVVVTDLNMPGGDGVSLAQSIREISDVPIIVLTGFRDAYSRRLRQIPRVTVLEKPLAWKDFLELVEAELLLSGSTVPSR